MKEARKIEAAFEIIRIVASLAIAYVIALLVLFFVSDEPLFVIQQFVLGPFSSPRRIGSIINLAVPFVLCGLGMCFIYSVGKLNMMGDGIFMLYRHLCGAPDRGPGPARSPSLAHPYAGGRPGGRDVYLSPRLAGRKAGGQRYRGLHPGQHHPV